MTPDKARQKLMDTMQKDVKELQEIMDAYRIDKGIPISCFAELLSVVAQEYRLIRQYIIPRP